MVDCFEPTRTIKTMLTHELLIAQHGSSGTIGSAGESEIQRCKRGGTETCRKTERDAYVGQHCSIVKGSCTRRELRISSRVYFSRNCDLLIELVEDI